MPLGAFVGAVPVRVERILYVAPGGEPDRSKGEFQVTFEDGRTLYLSPGPDGASLRVEENRWTDVFVEPLTPENREFVHRSGKWDIFDVSNDPVLSGFIGGALTEAEVSIDDEGVHYATLATQDVRATYTVDGDEGWLEVHRA